MKHMTQPRIARQKTRQLDDMVATANVPTRPRNGWIAAIRQALGMNKTQLARRMNIARQSLYDLEANEVKGSITLASLRNAAKGLDCDLQYILIPRMPLEQIIANQALRRADGKLGRINQSQAPEAAAINSQSLSRAVTDLAREFEVQRPADLWNE